MRDDTIDARLRDEIISKLVEKLRDHYIFPDGALEMAQMVQRRQEANEYAHLTSGTEFCLLLTTQLQEIRAPGPTGKDVGSRPISRYRMSRPSV
ncbi:MAG TPA: hypothetical protein VFB60_04825 [Ktedonobacteraceae bacterium]|nr:hypothetical protein [Ktedonobacteraceae bacterium]